VAIPFSEICYMSMFSAVKFSHLCDFVIDQVDIGTPSVGKRMSHMALSCSYFTGQIRARDLHLTRPSPCFSAGISLHEIDVFRLAKKINHPVTGTCPHPPIILNFSDAPVGRC
jgi:hypothetical protein